MSHIEKCWDCDIEIDTDENNGSFHYEYHDECGDCVNLLCTICYLKRYNLYEE